MIRSFAKKSGRNVKEVEKLWYKAKALAEEKGHKDDYPYIVGILKNMLNINEAKFKDFINSL